MRERIAPQINLGWLLLFLLTAGLFQTFALSQTLAKGYAGGPNGGVKRPAPQHVGNRISSCSEFKKSEINKSVLEAGIDKLRKGEAALGGIFYCRQAFPTLKKYALDADPKVREAIAYYLRLYYSTAALQLLIQQIEKYPTAGSAIPYTYAAEYPCYFFRAVKTRSLTQTLATRVKARNGEAKSTEIRLLGCLSPHDLQARKFLEEMSQSTFAVDLNDSDRQVQLSLVTYALAEAGVKAAEEKILADIEAASVSGIPEAIQSVLEKLKGFTNCRLLQPLARLILDKRAVSLDVADNGKVGKLEARVGDLAISAFTSAFGTEVTREKDAQWKPHTDLEMATTYQRVQKVFASGKFGRCRFAG